ncbi:MAG TPA: thioredoxin domain-containing protein, partial [bacterium]|nr:thioredoxin domain-containing protein [bacterium]
MHRNFLLLWLITWSVMGQVEKVSLPELERRLMLNKDSVLVVNFWATWCSPCIEELPLFDSLYQNAANYKS